MKRIYLIIGSVIILVSLIGAGLYIHNKQQSPGLPEDVRSQITDYSPYYPPKKSLPAGYYVDEQTFSFEQNVFNFTIKGANDSTLFVSQQKTPDNFDFSFFEKNIKNARNSQAKEGSIVVGEIEGRHIASMRYDNAWIMISTPSTVSLSVLETIAHSFRR